MRILTAAQIVNPAIWVQTEGMAHQLYFLVSCMKTLTSGVLPSGNSSSDFLGP